MLLLELINTVHINPNHLSHSIPPDDMTRPISCCHLSFLVLLLLSGLSGHGERTVLPLIVVKSNWERVIVGEKELGFMGDGGQGCTG